MKKEKWPFSHFVVVNMFFKGTDVIKKIKAKCFILTLLFHIFLLSSSQFVCMFHVACDPTGVRVPRIEISMTFLAPFLRDDGWSASIRLAWSQGDFILTKSTKMSSSFFRCQIGRVLFANIGNPKRKRKANWSRKRELFCSRWFCLLMQQTNGERKVWIKQKIQGRWTKKQTFPSFSALTHLSFRPWLLPKFRRKSQLSVLARHFSSLSLFYFFFFHSPVQFWREGRLFASFILLSLAKQGPKTKNRESRRNSSAGSPNPKVKRGK